MKTTSKLLAMLLMATTMVFAACEKDSTDKPENPIDNPRNENINLAETSWEGMAESDYLYQGRVNIHITCTVTLDFNDATSGEMFMNVDIEVPQDPTANQKQNETFPFTYTFNGKTCTLRDANKPTELLSEIQYNAANKTFTMTIEDAATVEMLGTNTIVLHLTRGTL